MNLKATLILLVGFALAVAAYLLTRDYTAATGGSNGGTHASTQNLESILDPRTLGPALKEIELDLGKGGTRLKLARIEGRWRVTQPHDFPADTQAVDELLTLLGNLRGSKSTQPHDPIPDPSSLQLTLDDAVIELRLGQRMGSGKAGLTLITGPDTRHFDADDTLHDLIDNLDESVFFARIIDAPLIAATSRISIASDGSTSLLIQDDGQWWIGEGANRQRAWEQGIPGQPGVNDYFHLLNVIDVYEHQRYDRSAGLAQFGLSRPLISVRFVPTGVTPENADAVMEMRVGVPADPADQTRYVSFGRSTDEYPAVFTVATNLALALGQPATSFRDPRITATPRTLIASLVLQTAGQADRAVTFNQDGSVTHAINNGPVTNLAPDKCALFLDRLTSPQAVGYVTERLDELQLIRDVTIMKKLNQPAEHFAIYEDPASMPDQPTVLVRRDTEPVALRVGRGVIEPLLDVDLLQK